MKNSARTLIVAAVSLALLLWFLRGARLDRVWVEIREADGLLVGVSLAATVVTMAIRAVRWQYLLGPLGGARFWPAFRTTTIGFAANAVLPARPGEVIRPYLLARQEGLSVPSTFATVVVERLLDSATVLLLLAAFVLVFDPGMGAQDGAVYRLVRAGGLAVGSGTVVLLAVLFAAAGRPAALGRWGLKLERLLPGRIAHAVAHLLQHFAEGLAIVRAPGRLALTLLLSLLLWLVIVVMIWAGIRAFHIELPFTGTFLLLALIAVGVSVPTPGGVGAFEAAVRIGLTSFYGVQNDRAVGAALVLHAASVLPTIVLGFLFLVQDGLDLGGMRKLATAAAEGDAG